MEMTKAFMEEYYGKEKAALAMLHLTNKPPINPIPKNQWTIGDTRDENIPDEEQEDFYVEDLIDVSYGEELIGTEIRAEIIRHNERGEI